MSTLDQFIAAMQPMPCNYDERSQKFTDSGVNLAWFAWQASRAAALAKAIAILETYQVSVGNSAVGEIACEMTMASLREIRDEIRALAKSEGENT